jgi:Predicted AAA-ATPase/PD-(D/E)XK nuclease superfamily
MPLEKLPIGIQDFETVITDGYTYIDKTKGIYDLIDQGKSYFLSRPRRFGKSLLISTLAAFFSGKRHLFKNLWIDTLELSWEEYPIIRLDMSGINNQTPELFERSLIRALTDIAAERNLHLSGETASDYLSSLIDRLAVSQKIVVLIDEYDKPIIDQLDNLDVAKKNSDILRRFYTILKVHDAKLKFLFLTGVTKFSKVSLFSGLNNLNDISLRDDTASLLGLTEKEIARYFSKDLASIAKKRGESIEQVYTKLKDWYNGYRFSKSSDAEKVYNPLSVMQFLKTGRIDNYWFSTATPTFALKMIREKEFPVSDFESSIIVGRSIDESYEIDKIDLATLLYQTGYLTIDDYDEAAQRYFLKFPNEEVRRSFLDHLLQEFTSLSSSQSEPILYKIEKALKNEDFERFFQEFNILLSSIPYAIQIPKEAYYHSLLYAILRGLSFDVSSEVMTSRGRIDMVFVFQESVSLFEFKIDSISSIAIEQIKQRKYFEKYAGKKITLVGANFDTKSRTISDWTIEAL